MRFLSLPNALRQVFHYLIPLPFLPTYLPDRNVSLSRTNTPFHNSLECSVAMHRRC